MIHCSANQIPVEIPIISTNLFFYTLRVFLNHMTTETAVFGGGCFWCTEAIFQELNGVVSVTSGYAGGPSAGSGRAPTYKEVCGGKTGLAEVIKIEYDPSKISYEDLLTVFFFSHDPTARNRQGPDVGEQYRSVILYTSENQKKGAKKFIKKLNYDKAYENPVVTEVKPLETFYSAEDYHQDYYKSNPDLPYCQIMIAPKIKKLREKFANLLRSKK